MPKRTLWKRRSPLSPRIGKLLSLLRSGINLKGFDCCKPSGLSMSMAEKHSNDNASTSEASNAGSGSTVELNIKTLDSQIFTFHVNSNMSVSSFKEKIAGEIGVPVEQQRLIFRGKVLKDDHLLSEYHVENGHTLHLVERQLVQSQTPSVTSSGETNPDNGGQANDGSAGAPRNRVGQISHSVVLGTFNVGDQGDGAVPDVTRVIGAVLNSLGIGNLTTANASAGAQTSTPSNVSGQPPQGTEAEAWHGNAGDQNSTGNQAQSGPFLSQPFQFPLTGVSLPLPSLHTPIPDSLSTLTDFINRMEGVLSRNGYRSDQSSTGLVDQPAVESPSNARGLPTLEALSIVLRHAQQLVGGGVSMMLSHIAGRLEREAGSTDPSVRSQIQTESVQAGLIMQHLGALFLELGRTMLTLRMGQSPAESGINAGPAVYISQSGPNPIMVQPFPLQTSPLFNATAASPTMGNIAPAGIIGNAPRHINIHIHAGTSHAPIASAVGARASSAEDAPGERSGVTASADSAPTRFFPVRNVVAGAVPARPTTITISPFSTAAQPIIGISTSQPPDSASLSSVMSEVNTRLRNFVGNMWAENQAPSGPHEVSAVQNSSTGSGGGGDTLIDHPMSVPAEGAVGISESHVPPQAEKEQPGSQQNSGSVLLSSQGESSCLVEASPCCSIEDLSMKPKEAPKEIEICDKSDNASDVPLGLGLGGLQLKRSRQSKLQPKSGDGGPSSALNQSHQVRVGSEQGVHSLAPLGSAVNMRDANDTATRQPPMTVAPTAAMPLEGQASDGQFDMMSMMSQFIQSPALNGLFSGLAARTGVASGDDLRNMFQQFTQNPAAMNTVNQLAQQLNRDDLQPMLGGLGSGQDGGLDFSRMVQQMMPIVSGALSGGSIHREWNPTVDLEQQQQNVNRRPSEQDSSYDQSSQIDIHEAIQGIMQQSSPQEVFHAVVQNAAHLYDSGGAHNELLNELCSDEGLANEFMEIFQRDLRLRFRDGGP
ncbi:hypothetical protein Nepgr_006495 [Nepenthes gracilis]|uniref:Ubiquitin-like domain-containing protein n=1 Tax=Nepenthes gracilis TaxID=150966 RepID=A0AAD3S5K7_NEPGR|nr:hypothetical protein Nepgr_006495 [Nepenthes gracilis]